MIVVEIQPTDPDSSHWRVWRANKARYDRPTRPNPQWAAREISYWCTVSDQRNAYYIELTMPLPIVGPTVATSPYSGARVVRLRYDWSAIERQFLDAPSALSTKQLSEEILCALASEGSRLRAALDYAKHVA